MPDQAEAAKKVTDFPTCKAAGGKCAKGSDGTMSCTMFGKTFKDAPPKAKAALDFTKITIESDGTRAGTKILVNGKAVENLGSLSFGFYNDDFSPNVFLSFSQVDKEVQPGQLRSYTSFSLVPPDDDDAAEAAKATLKQLPFTPHDLQLRGDRQNRYAEIK